MKVFTIAGSPENSASETASLRFFSFDPDHTSLSRAGNDLIIHSDSEPNLSLGGFFLEDEDGMPPIIVFSDGSSMQGPDFVRAFSPDMAAQWEFFHSGSGIGEYRSENGFMVDRLGALGSDAWQTDRPFTSPTDPTVWSDPTKLHTPDTDIIFRDMRPVALPTLPQPAAVPGAAVSPTPGGEATDSPSSEGEYIARAVLYYGTDNEMDTVNFRLLDQAALSRARALTAQNFTVSSQEGYFSNDYGTNADGSYYLTLTDAGKAALAAASGDLCDKVTVSTGSGTYTMQVVVCNCGMFCSSDENAASGVTGPLVAEWHTGDVSAASVRTNGLATEFWFDRCGGSTACLGTITGGDGNDTVNVLGAISGACIDLGGGTNSVSGQCRTDSARASAMRDSSITGEGLTTVTLHGESQSELGIGMYSVAAENLVDVTGQVAVSGSSPGKQAHALYSNHQNTLSSDTGITLEADSANGVAAVVFANGGNNDVASGGALAITGTAGSTAWGLYAGTGGVNTVSADGLLRIATASAKSSSMAVYATGGTNDVYSKDRVEIATNDAAGGIAVNVVSGSNLIKAGDGGINIRAEGSPGSGLSVSALFATGGSNTLSSTGLIEITAVSHGAGAAKGLVASAGRNVITSDDALGLIINAGDAAANRALYAYYSGSTGGQNQIIGGNGGSEGDNITITGGIEAAGPGSNSIVTGGGDDTLSLGTLYATSATSTNTVTTGAGDDTVTIAGMSATGVNRVSTGEGNDTVTVSGTITAKMNGQNIIDTGAGDDEVHLAANISGASSNKFQLLLGDGDDTVFLAGSSYANAAFDGGNGRDVLNIAGYQGAMSLAGLTAGIDFSGFEVLDMRNGAAGNTFNLDGGLRGLGVSGANYSGAFSGDGIDSLLDELTRDSAMVLFVHADAGDTVTASGGWAAAGNVEYQGTSYEAFAKDGSEYLLLAYGLLT